MIQQTIFDTLYTKYKINKPIRLIEFFAGYGSQALALKYLGVPFEHWKICEWAVKSIQAYKDIHFTDDFVQGGVLDIPKEEIIKFLHEKGISSNYNEPMNLGQIKRLNESSLYNIYENIMVTNNLVNIQQVKGEDLEIKDTDKYTYLLTYSFPCQDLSLAGKRQGMNDTSTRSGMLWEVERILDECKELGSLPEVLLMENVPQVHGEGNTDDFIKWQLKLEQLGYKNYWQDLIATDYGIPQTRNRCFMVSILGEFSYSFPPKQPLKLKLKDMLEENVDEKYYLSEKMIRFFTYNEQKQKQNGNGFKFNVSDGNVIAKTITTHAGSRMDDNYISIPNVLGGIGEKDSNNNTQWKQQNRVYEDNVSISITTSFNPYYAVNENVIIGSTQKHAAIKNDGICTTLTSAMGAGGGHVPMHNYTEDLRIRKLTPKECFRLMGVHDEDFENCAKNQSNASLYHLAGDSIVVNVLMAIFKELL